jgi:hypothetical protein
MADMCGDNRFEIIEKAKKDLLESTNIQTSKDEMQVLDDFLFRCWQMDWLGKYDQPMTNADRIRNFSDEDLYKFLRYFGVCRICKHRKDEGCDNRGCTQEEVDGFLKEWLQAEVKEGESNA